ncbi:MAG: BCCT family transporter [Gammaproteobacteria bacterium]|nr:BCCT family transporter [Gammaproteobacteria bacterium]
MSDQIKPPFTDVNIKTADSGFYQGYNVSIALISKLFMVVLVIWALVAPGNADRLLGALNSGILSYFNSFYTIATGAFMFFMLAIAIYPKTGKKRLGLDTDRPEFSTFSWFAMMFGAGLGVGLMVFSVAEPMYLWGSNPDTVRGVTEANTAAGLGSTYEYTFLHYGFHAWAIYLTTAICMGYYAYRRDVPLTIRSTLTPLFGKAMNGALGDLVDILAVVATILGISVTIGFGISQFVDGVYSIAPNMEWLMKTEDDGSLNPSTYGLIFALVVIMVCSILSAASGVGKGVKYLSNINLVLSATLLGTFIIFGSLTFALKMYGLGLVEYISGMFETSFVAHGTDTELGKWQSGWTTFYWAWWIAFSPFVGLFLARISRGRTIREIVLGAMIAPALVCFLWMTMLGGTAIDLELTGVAKGAISGENASNMLFTTLGFMFEGVTLHALTIMCVVLVMTYLITSADSGILVLNTIMSGGNPDETGIKHRIIWGLIITAIIGSLLVAGGGMDALKKAMIIGALPFAIVMVLMCVSLTIALFMDAKREKQG